VSDLFDKFFTCNLKCTCRWGGIIKRRIYKVRGSNALWHQDGNEKLKHWGFWVHGCIDGHSRLIIYLECTSNKEARTVTFFFLRAVAVFGWPSRVRGDYGTENNGIEVQMIAHWGEAHRAYLRGRYVCLSEKFIGGATDSKLICQIYS
jgi:hypothetical protein